MEINKYISKKNLIYLCIIIIILIIFRILYNKIYSNTEGFDLSNNSATDLLTKIKSPEAQLDVNPTNSNSEMQIYSWSNQLYNIQNVGKQSKAIAFYKPNLIINNVQYVKLGDIVSQNSDYSLPTFDQFTLLIKKNTSDIKPPTRFDLMGKIDNPSFKTSYYKYLNYITNTVNYNVISSSLNNCANTVNTLNSLIQKNLPTIKNRFVKGIYKIYKINNEISIYDFLKNNRNIIENFESGDYNDFIPSALITTPQTNDDSTSFDLKKTTVKDNNYSKIIGLSSVFVLPSGITGNITIPNGQTIDISIPSTIDAATNKERMLYNNLAGEPYGKLAEENIQIFPQSELMFSYVPITEIINFIISLCNDIKNIYNNQSQSKSNSESSSLLTYLNLSPSSAIIDSILDKMTGYSTNINAITLSAIKTDILSLSMSISTITATTTIIELVFYIIFTMTITYNVTYLTFNQSNLSNVKDLYSVKKEYQGCFDDSGGWDGSSIFNNNQINGSWWTKFYNDFGDVANLCAEAVRNQNSNYNTFGIHGEKCYAGVDPGYAGPLTQDCSYRLGDKWSSKVYKVIPNKLTITNYTNDIVSNIPASMYSIITNPAFSSSTVFTTIVNNITKFSSFIKDISNNNIGDFPLQIYKPIAPENYISLGDVFCNTTSDLKKIINSNNVGCVPSQCVKEIRDWTTNDKIYEYNKSGKYFGIYFNPYTGTFITTNVNAQQLPEGKVCKVVACVAKCNTVEELQKADDCARKYYNLNKQSETNTPLTSSLVGNQEEEYYLDKLQAQSESITRLKQRAQRMQTDVDKATIVNREMNKNKLQDYVDVQKRNIDIIMKRLEEDKNKIKTDINIPSDTLNSLMQMIKNAESLSSDEKTNLLTQIATSKNLPNAQYNKNFNKILNACPQYDLSNLVSKQTASDVCFGCDTPK